MTPQEALNKTKVHLLMHKGTLFISNVFMMLKHEISDEFPTAATDGTYVKYNPEFFINLTKEERLGLLLHEVWHVGYMHMLRKVNHDPIVWNMAADYVINLMLVSNGFSLPKEALLDTKYLGMSTEQVYEFLIQNAKEQPQNFNPDIQSSQLSEQESQKLTNIIVKAAQIAALSQEAGSIPQEILRAIEELLNPKLTWTDVLYRYFDSTVKQNNSWIKPNKRYLPDWYLPSIYSKSIGHLTIAIDTSGSITDGMLRAILSEIDYINQTFRPDNLIVLGCDCKIHNIYHVDPYDSILDYKFTGGGDTSFYPTINYCKENNTNLLVYFTDLDARQITEDLDFPILWVCYSDHAPAIVGETVYAKL